MAVSTVETIIANPANPGEIIAMSLNSARKRKKNMAKRMSLKQRLHFGSARVRAAAKAALRSSRKRKKTSSRSNHRTHNPGTHSIHAVLGSPARRNKTVARPKTKRSTSKSHRAGRPRHKKHHNPSHRRVYQAGRTHHRTHRRRSHNPAGYAWGDVFGLGVGAVVGSAGSSGLTQLVLQASNTGAMGYIGNLVSTFILAWVGGMGPFRRFRGFAPGILAGGIGSLLRRIIADYSLFGGYSASLGMGDYMVANWVTPQRLQADFRSLTDATVGQGYWGAQNPSALLSSSGVSTRGLGLEGDPGTYGSVGY